MAAVDLFAPTPTPPIDRSCSSTSAKKTPIPVLRVKGVWSAPATRAASVTWSQSTASPPPVKHIKLERGRRDRVKTPGGKNVNKGPRGIAESAVTPPKVLKGQKKSAQSGKSNMAEKGTILPGGRDATAITVVTGQETTAGFSAQEGSSIITGQETTAGVSAQEGSSIVTGQETTARVSAQEGSSIVTGQETTARVSAQEGPAATALLGNEGPSCHTPMHRSETAMASTAEQVRDRHGKAPLNRAKHR
ncbi:hypothetical protein NDU88_009630 [Pleurodeles waltl]|uniref:Uncharacterized protein n=1 Tax=Pleurodeles waltl TaxID=8319 RepID=A0AAV7QVU6_PLEWA|nr:hypothetical protein NDU88_009630 [Pleurodeles waltl]